MTSTGRLGIGLLRSGLVAGVVLGGLACGPEPFAQEGIGFGPSRSFQVDAGTASISWSAWDAAPPVDGCLFGLLLDLEGPRAADDPAPAVSYNPPKLAYQVLDAGGSYNGRSAMELPAGRYRFLIEGSCFWSIRFDSH